MTTSPPPPGRLRFLLALALVLVVAAGLMVWRDRQRVDVDAVAQQAATDVQRLVSFEKGHLAQELEAERELLTEDFAAAYAERARASLGTDAVRKGVSVTAALREAGISGVNRERINLLLVLELRSRVGAKQPRVAIRVVKVTMRWTNGEWRIGDLATV